MNKERVREEGDGDRYDSRISSLSIPEEAVTRWGGR